MADSIENGAEASAERAYAAASEAVSPTAAAAPNKGKRGRKPTRQKAAAAPVAAVPPVEEPETLAPIVEVEVEAPAAPEASPAASVSPEPVPEPSPAIASPAPKPKAVKAKAAPKTAKSPATAKPKPLPLPQFAPAKEPIMENPTNFADSLKDANAGAQEKAKDMFAKSAAAVGEIGEFTKGNVEALVESGKILASGIQEIGSRYVADTKSALETLTGDVKDLAAVKSPTDFVKLHSEILRRNFDSAIAYGSKNGEAMMKLANDVFAPISGRVSLAVEKVRKVA